MVKNRVRGRMSTLTVKSMMDNGFQAYSMVMQKFTTPLVRSREGDGLMEGKITPPLLNDYRHGHLD